MYRLNSDSVKQTRIYLDLKYYPVNTENFDFLNLFIYHQLAFDIYYGKLHMERYDLTRVWAL